MRARRSRAHAAAYRRRRREHAQATRTAGRSAALWVLGLGATAVVAALVAAIAIATTSDDAERRASAAVAAAVIGLVLVVVAVAAARATGDGAGPALLALADRNGLALIPWRRRDVAPTGTLLVHASHQDVDVLQDADGIAWGRSTLLVGGGRRSRSGMHGEQLAFLEVPLRAAVPHVLLADARASAAASLVPEAIGAVELAPAQPSPWRAWTTERDVAGAAGAVTPALLEALERHAPGLDLELVGDRALLTRRVAAAWCADEDAWLDVVDAVRIHLAPALRAVAAARSGAWDPLPADEPLGRSLRLALVQRARRTAMLDGAIDVASGGAS